MRKYTIIALGLTIAGITSADSKPVAAEESSLSGSRASMTKQNRVARENDFSFLRTPGQVERLVDDGRLVELAGNRDYTLANVSYPYARPVLRTFVERLGAQYREACNERLVVTSLTRPVSEQPRNASPLSVHPAGMAVDLRVPANGQCRSWLEGTLLSLERRGLLDVTRERRPPHYHVAVFPEEYGTYAMAQIEAETAAREAQLAAIAALPPAPVTTPAVARASVTPMDMKGPGVFVSVLLALAALIGGTAVMVRTHADEA